MASLLQGPSGPLIFHRGMPYFLCFIQLGRRRRIFDTINRTFVNINIKNMAAEPTSLGIGIAVTGAIAFGILYFTKSRRKQKEKKEIQLQPNKHLNKCRIPTKVKNDTNLLPFSFLRKMVLSSSFSARAFQTLISPSAPD
jgi:hypothetical protein